MPDEVLSLSIGGISEDLNINKSKNKFLFKNEILLELSISGSSFRTLSHPGQIGSWSWSETIVFCAGGPTKRCSSGVFLSITNDTLHLLPPVSTSARVQSEEKAKKRLRSSISKLQISQC
ncbi:UNVERIFIED_CONTAM: hypothetical protein Slati_4194100 [Sesamum latifolium]|uniref:Uncharacterized protein n=1 Tax=Sesamum latifolium TaxID=2727402 RepID=A0AAW2TAL2_9LAMI